MMIRSAPRVLNIPSRWRSNVRSYKSLVGAINDFDPIPRTRTKSSSLNCKTKDVPLSPILKKHLNKTEINQNLVERIKMLKKKLKPHYSLSDELLIKSLFSFNEDYVEIHPADDTQKQLVSIHSIERLGRDLFNLQRSLFLVDSLAESYQDSLAILDERIATLMKKKGTFNTFLRNQSITDIALNSSYRIHDKNINAVRTMHIVIGLIAYQHNRERAAQFIQEGIIQGKDGLLYILLERLNR